MTGKLLLDSNAVIALFAGAVGVRDQLSQASELYVPAIVLGELYYGARKSGRVAANVSRVEQFAATSSVIDCTAETAKHYGIIKEGLRSRGRPIPENDIWIAALALQHGLTVLTRDEHFREVAGLALESY